MKKRQPVFIIKASGEREPFDPQKIERSMRRAGAPASLARDIAAEAAQRVSDGMTTREIYALAFGAMRRVSKAVAARYSLKEAMRRLGPAGYDFEKFIAEVLRARGFTTELPDLLSGMCVRHEVDVVAQKDGRTTMVECKYRNEAGIYVRLKDVMATWARFEDLREAYVAKKCPIAFNDALIVCNTKITSDGVAFGSCKKMSLVGWRYPEDGGLEQWIEEQQLYPVTVIGVLDRMTREKLSAANIMLCRDLVERDAAALARAAKLPRDRIDRLRAEAEKIIRL